MITTRTTRRGLIAVALATALALLPACGASGGKGRATDSTTSTAPSTTAPTSTAPTTATPTTGATTSSSTTVPTTAPPTTGGSGGGTTPGLAALPSGWHYVYFNGISQGSIRGQAVSLVTFDKVDFLTGKAAVDAAHKAGAIPPGQDYVDNDYYISNTNPLLRTMAVVPDAQVTQVGCGGSCTTQEPSSIDVVAAQKGLFKILVQNVGSDSTITSVEGVFLP
ncbi:MAG: hypothetical protein JWM05_2374 [Acidimicrobiales bacterium]|nr:hypothetical protein [Acidimicrobiales bacterium]